MLIERHLTCWEQWIIYKNAGILTYLLHGAESFLSS